MTKIKPMKMSNAMDVDQKESMEKPPKIPGCAAKGQSLPQFCGVSLAAQTPSPHTGDSTHFLVSIGFSAKVPHWLSSPQRRPCTPPEHVLQPLQTQFSTHTVLCWPKTVPAKKTAEKIANSAKNNFFEKNKLFHPIVIVKTSILIKSRHFLQILH